jgi:DNA invertase Pin-like site-specific DNA recombinase
MPHEALRITLAYHRPVRSLIAWIGGGLLSIPLHPIVERVRSGVARAKASGTKSGKAFGRPRVPAETEQRIRDALATPGRPGFHKIAAQFGVATGTVQRIAQA